MRERILTPFFPLPRGENTTAVGIESSGVPARSLIGQLIDNGRYILRRKVGHTRTTVRFAAHDLMGDIAVSLPLHPDETSNTGFRVGTSESIAGSRELPRLRTRELPQITPEDLRQAQAVAPGRAHRAWSSIRSLFRRGKPA